LAWLKKFPETFDAGFVLPPLLGRTDLEPAAAQQAVAIGLIWLKKFPETLDAGFVLPPLLGRTDLEPAAAQQAVAIGLIWLKKFPETLDAQFVLHSLLGRSYLESAAAQEIIGLSLIWMEIHNQSTDAGFVLKFLLRRPDLSPAYALDLKRSAMGRLQLQMRDPGDEEASFLLRWCLQSRVNDPILDHDLLGLAVSWLEANERRKDRDFVFNRILRRPSATRDQWLRGAKSALLWIRNLRPGQPGRDYAINSLLTRGDFLNQDELDFVIREAISWLNENSSGPNSDRIRRSLKKAKRFLAPESPLREELDRLGI
jgi:hypothetical protein